MPRLGTLLGPAASMAGAMALLAMVAMNSGCADRSAAPPTASAPANDSVLDEAAQRVQPILDQTFPETFAGLVLDHGGHAMIIYRRPDSALDERIRRELPGVRIVFRDAQYSRADMQRFIQQLQADDARWRQRGIHLNGAAPNPDGTGVEVFTSDSDVRVQRELASYYPQMTIKASNQTAILPTAAAPPPIGNTVAPSASRSIN